MPDPPAWEAHDRLRPFGILIWAGARLKPPRGLPEVFSSWPRGRRAPFLAFDTEVSIRPARPGGGDEVSGALAARSCGSGVLL
jgi:hypothetical protein